jgi:hypothetical protein
MFSRMQKPVRQGIKSTGGARPETPGADLLPALQQLSVRLERLVVTDEMSWLRACELIERINQAARSNAATLLREYVLGTQQPENPRNEEIWSTVTAYLDQLVQGYRWCLDRRETDAASCTAAASTLAPVAGNAIRACAARLKWAYLRYDPVVPAQWQALTRTYVLAERADVASEAFVVPEVLASSSTAEREFVKALVLAASSPGGLLPTQLQVAECLIEQCAPHLALARQSLEPVRYFIDLAATDGPQRLLASGQLPGAGRIIVLAGAVTTLRQLVADLDEGALTTPDLGLDPRCSLDLVRSTARHLLRYWSAPSLERRHARNRDALRVAVVRDFDEVAAKVVGATPKNLAGSTEEHWTVEDHSDGGLLVLLSRRQGRRIEAGGLLAFRYPNLARWHAGIIRRVQREGEETRRVGIEKLTTEISGVILVPRFRRKTEEPPGSVVGMFMVDTSAAADQVTLLLPMGTFSPSVPLEMRAGSRDDLLIPQELIESGPDYQIARYKLLAQPGSE